MQYTPISLSIFHSAVLISSLHVERSDFVFGQQEEVGGGILIFSQD